MLQTLFMMSTGSGNVTKSQQNNMSRDISCTIQLENGINN